MKSREKKLIDVEQKLDGDVVRTYWKKWQCGIYPNSCDWRIWYDYFYYDGPHHQLQFLFFWVLYSPWGLE
jgi:hypothetical protein